MSEHRATIIWNRNSRDFSYDAYSRDHTWEFENGIKIDASAAPDFLGDVEQAAVERFPGRRGGAEGDVFGEISLVNESPTTATCSRMYELTL